MSLDVAEDVDAIEFERVVEENRRLRREYARARRSGYRRTAVALVAVGALATLGGLLFPATRAVLFALGATGLFAGILTYYLTPERFLAASAAAAVYRALAEDGAAIEAELGLHGERVYVPRPGDVRLFVPQSANYRLPADEALSAVFVVGEDDRERGISHAPTGGPLFREFEAALSGPLADDPATLAAQLTDGLVEGLELAGRADPEVDADGNRLTVGITDSALGPVDRFDHPIASVLGVGLALGLASPVTVDVTPAEDDRYDWLVTASWGER